MKLSSLYLFIIFRFTVVSLVHVTASHISVCNFIAIVSACDRQTDGRIYSINSATLIDNVQQINDDCIFTDLGSRDVRVIHVE